MTDVNGFSLVELAVVLAVLGLLAAGLLAPLEVQMESRDRAAAQRQLEQAREALYGFAMRFGRLPCPDADGDGRADPAFDAVRKITASCTRNGGSLPGVELGVPAVDPWGQRLRYRVTAPRFTWPDSDGLCNGGTQLELDFCAMGELEIHGRGDNPATTGAQEGKFDFLMASEVPALVWSGGRNGAASGDMATPSGTDEAGNQDGDARFLFRPFSRGQAGCSDAGAESVPLCEFDDLGVWLSPYALFERLVAARRLP